MEQMFFDSWTSLARVIVVGVLAYGAVVIFLRISGRRTLSKMNAFDLVATVALGSTLATVLLSKDVALAEGALALALLIGLQFLITWLSVRTRWVRQLVTGEPILLMYGGEMIEEALLHARVTRDEVLAAVRQAGLAHLKEVGAVILETNGVFSVLRCSPDQNYASLEGVLKIKQG